VAAAPLPLAEREVESAVSGRDGRTIVLRHGPALDVLAVNELDDGFDASPAVAGDEIYLRGRKALYRISR
jgi:outer membrane protein assembly factor BamB